MSADLFLMCARKQQHASRKGAAIAASALRKRAGAKSTQALGVYRCPACRQWHIGKDARYR